MSKKSIVLEYQTPLEFVSIYTQKGFEEEKQSLEKYAEMPIIEIIANIAGNEDVELIDTYMKFAPEVGLQYCVEHSIFHEYENCPFCSLNIKIG